MFTGLIEEIGIIRRVEPSGGMRRFVIYARKVMDDLDIDDSIAVDGVCLTVVAVDKDTFQVEAVAETLRKTTLAGIQVGTGVNLERSLRPKDRMGGHFVQGHVDTIARVVALQTDSGSKLLTIRIPERLQSYLISEGSIAVNGVSLTIARLAADEATIALIPHTLACTNLDALRQGSQVNIEVDLIAKYIERILNRSNSGGISQDWLKQMGYQ